MCIYKLFMFYMIIQIIDSILKYQDSESKMFYQVPNFPGREKNYLETSGSCFNKSSNTTY